MLNINVSNPKAFEKAILSAYKFADTRPHNEHYRPVKSWCRPVRMGCV